MPATRKTPAPRQAKRRESGPAVRRGMRVSEITAILPESGPLLAEYGLHCFGCSANTMETLEEGCLGHGFSDAEIDGLVDDLNALLRDRPPRPQTLTITADAAGALKSVLAEQGKSGQGLAVIMDESGFCMEISARAKSGEATFLCREVPDVPFFAGEETLARIGGSTIDFREGRFKLDLPEDLAPPACQCGGGKCTCADRRERKP